MDNFNWIFIILCVSIVTIICIYKNKRLTTKFNLKKDSIEFELSITKEDGKKEN